MAQRRLNKDSAKIIFWSNDINAEYPKIEPASVRRDWMDKTYNKLAYKCTPLLDAMSNGWEIKLPQDVVVKWNGLSEGLEGEDANNVSIISGEFYKNIKVASNDTGVGAITFTFNLVAETDNDHHLVVSGPLNYPFKDASPLTGLLRSNHFMDHPLQITWKINTANKEILFPKGMPVCFISINKKNIAENTDVEVRQLRSEKKEKLAKYTNMRSEHFKENGAYSFPQFYKNGIDENGNKAFDSIKKNILKPIKYISDDSES